MDTRQWDAYLQLLADEYRRRTVSFLRTTEGDVSLAELSANVHEPPPDGNERRDPESVAVELHHVHLPKLAAHDLVEYDADSGLVRYLPDERTDTALESLTETVAKE